MSIGKASRGRLLTSWWWGFVMTVFLASAPLLADQDKDLLDLESGRLGAVSDNSVRGKVERPISFGWLKYHWMEQLQRSPLSQ